VTPEEKRIACHVCRKEIPEAAALHAEAEGYILHFCEPGCLAAWRKNLRPGPSGPKAVDSDKEKT